MFLTKRGRDDQKKRRREQDEREQDEGSQSNIVLQQYHRLQLNIYSLVTGEVTQVPLLLRLAARLFYVLLCNTVSLNYTLTAYTIYYRLKIIEQLHTVTHTRCCRLHCSMNIVIKSIIHDYINSTRSTCKVTNTVKIRVLISCRCYIITYIVFNVLMRYFVTVYPLLKFTLIDSV
jgi:hypothetical protein